jgi:hypothetical protein
VEMRSVEEASNAMALDGIIFEVILLCCILLFGCGMFDICIYMLLICLSYLFTILYFHREHLLR